MTCIEEERVLCEQFYFNHHSKFCPIAGWPHELTGCIGPACLGQWEGEGSSRQPRCCRPGQWEPGQQQPTAQGWKLSKEGRQWRQERPIWARPQRLWSGRVRQRGSGQAARRRLEGGRSEIPKGILHLPPIFCFSFQSSFKSSTFACVGQFDYVFWYGILHLLVHYTLPTSGCNWLLSAAADQKVQGSKMTKLVGSLFGSCFSHLHHKWHVTFWAGLFFSKFFPLFNSVIFLAVHIKFKSMFFTYSFKNAFICKN